MLAVKERIEVSVDLGFVRMMLSEDVQTHGVCCLDAAVDITQLDSFKTHFFAAWDILDRRINEVGIDRHEVQCMSVDCNTLTS